MSTWISIAPFALPDIQSIRSSVIPNPAFMRARPIGIASLIAQTKQLFASKETMFQVDRHDGARWIRVILAELHDGK